MSAINQHLYNEINYNLGILGTTLDKINDPSKRRGESIEGVDLAFIEIFLADINQLRTEGFDSDKIAKLNAKLEPLADRMVDSANKVFGPNEAFVDVEVPFMGKKSSFKELEKEYQNGNGYIKKGLAVLDEGYEFYRIRGDGHCLFRSVAAGVVRKLSLSDEAFCQGVLSGLDALKKKYASNPYISEEHFVRIRTILQKVAQDHSEDFFEKTMSERETSEEMTEFLRRLACARNHARLDNDVDFARALFAEASANDYDSVQDYLKDMADMSKKLSGGEPELQALAEALQIDLHILDAKGMGEYESRKDEYQNDALLEKNTHDKRERTIESSVPSIMTVDLLYRPGHYDFVVRRNG